VAISEWRHVAAAEQLSKVVNHGSHAAENVATNRERTYLAQNVLRLASLNFLENFSTAVLELFLVWLLSHTRTPYTGGGG
jgi:hypothetical protein